MTDFPTLLYILTCEIPTFLYTWSLKKVPFSGTLPGVVSLFFLVQNLTGTFQETNVQGMSPKKKNHSPGINLHENFALTESLCICK